MESTAQIRDRNVAGMDALSCTGCRMCESLCPKQCIAIEEDEEGFLVARVDEGLCIHCGICTERCPQTSFIQFSGKIPPAAYAAILTNPHALKNSASGGAFMALAEYVLQKGGVVFGCVFDDKRIARHTAVTSVGELAAMQGSKYVQSDTGKTFAQAKTYLEQGRHVLYTGTPCQIAGLKSYMGCEYDNLIAVDLICHGVPSPRLFKQNIAWLEMKKRIKVEDYTFRSKKQWGWGCNYCYSYHDVKRSIIGERCGRPDEDPYYHAFITGASYRECCYKCKYATVSREGDFTIGDYWGVEQIHPEIPSGGGVSLVLVNTKKASRILQMLGTLDLTVSSLMHATKYQHNLMAPTPRPRERNMLTIIDQECYDRFANHYMFSRVYMIARLKTVAPQRLKSIIKRFVN